MLPEVYSEVPCSVSDALVELDEQGARDALALTTSAVARLVERFDIEPYSDFSSK